MGGVWGGGPGRALARVPNVYRFAGILQLAARLPFYGKSRPRLSFTKRPHPMNIYPKAAKPHRGCVCVKRVSNRQSCVRPVRGGIATLEMSRQHSNYLKHLDRHYELPPSPRSYTPGRYCLSQRTQLGCVHRAIGCEHGPYLLKRGRKSLYASLRHCILDS